MRCFFLSGRVIQVSAGSANQSNISPKGLP
jgi:hypothetical protein